MRVFTDAARDEEVVGLGWRVEHNGTVTEDNTYLSGSYTSMDAEYIALLRGLREARGMDDHISLFSDCDPLVEKMKSPNGDEIWLGRYRLYQQLVDNFETHNIYWIPRSQNGDADDQAWLALERGRRER